MRDLLLRLVFLSIAGFVLAFALHLYVVGVAYAEQGDAVAGKEVFEKRCKQCHGEKGEGNGVVAEKVYPPPRNFTWGVFKYKTSPVDQVIRDEDMLRTINNGFGEASMPDRKSTRLNSSHSSIS